MKFSEMIEGLQILAKYEEKGLETHINGADHDVVWASSAHVDEDELERANVVEKEGEEYDLRDTRISDEDHERLRELGWFISTEYGEAWTRYR